LPSQFSILNGRITQTRSPSIGLYKTINEASALWSAELDDNEWDNIIDYAQALLAGKRSETGGQDVKPPVWDELISGHQVQTARLITNGARKVSTVFLPAALITNNKKR
jgi:hypothetical protein